MLIGAIDVERMASRRENPLAPRGGQTCEESHGPEVVCIERNRMIQDDQVLAREFRASRDLLGRILDEAFQLMMEPGIKVQNAEARQLLAEVGAMTVAGDDIVRIPEKTIRGALETVPSQFQLFDREGVASVCYGGDAVHFDPGSAAVHVLDPQTLQHRPAETTDLVRIVKVAEMLPQLDAQSTAVVCNDVPEEIGDLYRLYVVLMLSRKPIVTGAFGLSTVETMVDMLGLCAGGREALRQKPESHAERIGTLRKMSQIGG